MSIESRLAAKERSRKARRKSAVKKWCAILILPVLALIIFAGYRIHKSATTLDYSKYLAKDGTIKGVDARKYLSEFPDLNTIELDFEPTEESINTKMESTMKSLQEAKDGTPETTEDSTEVSYIAGLNKEWVENYAAETLGEAYEHTEEGFREYVKDLARKDNEDSVETLLTTYMNEHVTVEKYPFWYTRNQRKVADSQNETTFQFYQALGYLSADMTFDDYCTSYYGSLAKYKKELKVQAKEIVKYDLIWLAVFDELKLTATVEDAKAHKIEEGGKAEASQEEKDQYWNDLVKSTGLAYQMLEYRMDIAKHTLGEMVLEKAKAAR